MRGLIFRSFQDFIETRFSAELLDATLSLDGLRSTDGAYTTVGDYPTGELVEMIGFVSAETSTPANELIQAFGEYLFAVLATAHSEIVTQFESCFDLLAGIETVIHKNVRKLYDRPELPTFDVLEHSGDRILILRYSSPRPFADLAAGLIRGALAYYELEKSVDVQRKDLSDDGMNSEFHLTRKDA